MASRWCFVEIAQAKALGKAIFPITISPCRVENILNDRQVIDLTAVGRTKPSTTLRRPPRRGARSGGQFPLGPEAAPFPGLNYFDAKDAGIYFGREDEVRQVIETLTRMQRQGEPRLLVVVGSSGSGKSSLVRAGVLPRLGKDRSQWALVDPFRPGAQPISELARALFSAFPEGPADPTGRQSAIGLETGGNWCRFSFCYPQVRSCAATRAARFDEARKSECAESLSLSMVECGTPWNGELVAVRFVDRNGELVYFDLSTPCGELVSVRFVDRNRNWSYFDLSTTVGPSGKSGLDLSGSPHPPPIRVDQSLELVGEIIVRPISGRRGSSSSARCRCLSRRLASVRRTTRSRGGKSQATVVTSENRVEQDRGLPPRLAVNAVRRRPHPTARLIMRRYPPPDFHIARRTGQFS